MCSPASVAVVKDSHYTALSTGSTFSAMIGHLFNMSHDDSECLYTFRLYNVSFVSVIQCVYTWSLLVQIS